MHASVMSFVAGLPKELWTGKRVLEVGSCNVNGSVRSIIQSSAKEYVGVDIDEGLGVDRVCDAGMLHLVYDPESFDVVISTEMLEHAERWDNALENMKAVVKPGGYLILTTRSYGFPFHNPPDHWRFEIHHLAKEMMGWQCSFSNDPQVPGVFMVAAKTGRPTVLAQLCDGAIPMTHILASTPDYPVFAEFATLAEKVRGATSP